MFICFKSIRGQIILAAAVLLAIYLISWHGADLAAFLSFAILLSCPLMHVFMHGGHGHWHAHDPHTEGKTPNITSAQSGGLTAFTR